MISFIVCLALLITGYLTYGKIVDNTFGPDDRETPAVRINDGVDYVVMPQWKLFLVQLLNIAGLGPIFGALQGALWGPVVFLWITFGTIFAGGVHDYFSGMISERNDGASIAEVTGKYLGHTMQNVMRVFSVVLLIMVGTVFAVGAIDYTVIWRYFSWTNQTLAMIVLWAAAMYLFTEKKNFWIAAVPATFMSAVSCTYFILAPECLGSLLNSKTADGAVIYNTAVAYPIGIVFAILLLALFIRATKKHGTKKNA